MTTRLALRVDAAFQPGDDLAGTVLVGRVLPLASGPAQEGKSLSGGPALEGLLLPAGHAVAPLEVEVAPGRYVCEVAMPSGKVMSEEALAVADETTLVVFNAADTPHEGYAWQRLTGNVGSAVPVTRPKIAPSLTKQFFGPAGADLEALDAPPVARPLVGWVGAPADAAFTWRDLNAMAASQRVADRSQLLDRLGGWRPVEPVDGDDGTALYRFTGGGPVGGPPDPSVRGPRRFAFVHGGDNAYLVALPVPWSDVGGGGEVPAEIMVEYRPSRRGSPVAVTVRDPRLGSGLAYLAKGSLREAARVFSDAEDMLFGKGQNPLAAAAGAYVLVGTSPGGEDRWHRWVGNLRQRFQWLPDGAILHATLQLRQAATDRDLEAARAGLVEAAGRGVPLYTLGLRWLVDGLAAFPADDEAQRLLGEIRRLSWRVDMSQPFVVLRLNGVGT